MAFEERALFFRRLAEPHLVARPVNIFLFKRPRRHPHEFCGALQVGFGQIDETLLIAAINTPTLAAKAKRVQALIVPFFPGCLVLYFSGPGTPFWYKAAWGLTLIDKTWAIMVKPCRR